MAFTRSLNGLYLPQTISRDKKDGELLQDIDMFARNGRVILRKPDANGNVEENSLSQASARERLEAFGDMIKRYKQAASEQHNKLFRIKAQVTEAFASRLEETIKQAEEQGEFEDENMRRSRLRSRPVTVSMMSKGKV